MGMLIMWKEEIIILLEDRIKSQDRITLFMEQEILLEVASKIFHLILKVDYLLGWEVKFQKVQIIKQKLQIKLLDNKIKSQAKIIKLKELEI